MKTDALAHRTNVPATREHETGVRSGRWLADLERALWEADNQHRASEELPASAPPGRRTNAQGPRSAAGQLQERAEAMPTRALANRNAGAGPDVEMRAGVGSAATALPVSLPLRTAEASPGPRTSDDSLGRLAIDISKFAPASPQVVAVEVRDSLRHAPTNSIAEVAMRASVVPSFADQSELPQPAYSPSAPAPRYATRVFQVRGDGELQVNLRDVALDGTSETAVASLLLVEMRAAGLSMRRLYINGKLFVPSAESTPLDRPSTFPAVNKE